MVLKRIATIILFFLFFSLLPGCGGGGGGGGGGVSTATVTVYVFDVGKPVANVSVCLINPATDREATAYKLTDTQGRVIFTDVFTGNYYIEQNGYHRDLKTYRVALNTSNEFFIDAIILPDPPHD